MDIWPDPSGGDALRLVENLGDQTSSHSGGHSQIPKSIYSVSLQYERNH